MDLRGTDESTEVYAQDWPTGADASGQSSGRVISLYRRAIEEVRAAELERLHNRLPTLDGQSKQEIHLFADRLVANMVDPPLDSLRQETHEASRNALLGALVRLFRLNG